MFGQSILVGLDIFKFPLVLVCTLALLLLCLGFLILMRLLTNTAESQDAVGPGCLVPVVGLLFQGLLTSLFVLLLLPFLTLPQPTFSWSQVEPFAFIALRAGILATLVVFFISFVPFLGRFIASSPGLENFIIAVLLFRFLSPTFLMAQLKEKVLPPGLFPGVWETVGYLLTTLALTRIVMFVILMIARSREKKNASGNRTPIFLRQVLGPTLDILIGILVFFMYAAYIRLGVIPFLLKQAP